MQKEQVDEMQLDDAFDDTYIAMAVPRQTRGHSYSVADTQQSPQVRHHRRSCSSLFSSQSLSELPAERRRFSSSSSAPSCRFNSSGSQGSLGPSSTPGSVPEFVIPERRPSTRPSTMTSCAEILYQIDGNKLKGYHSLILKEMRGELSPDEHLEKPVCKSISTLDLTFSSVSLQDQFDDCLSDFKF